jgi:hypothetical protein
VIGTTSDGPDGDLLDSCGGLAATTDSQSERVNTLFSISPTKACGLLLESGVVAFKPTEGTPDLSYQVEHSIETTTRQMIAKIVSIDLFVQYYVNK